jgi:DNA-binding CsgD family transcriptional regulator
MNSHRAGQSNATPLVVVSSKRSVHRNVNGDRAATSGVREVILEGRRYRLVPIEDDEPSSSEPDVSVAIVLTARELQIVALVAGGRVNKQIADELRISEWTVSTHLRRIFAKLGVDTRAAMVSRCVDLLSKRDS